MKNCVVIGFLAVMFVVHAFAKSVNGVDFSETVSVAGKTLVLNGIGERLATIFSVRVYTAALYLTEKNKNAESVIDSASEKSLVMVFHRDVEKKDIEKAWREGLEKNCSEERIRGELKPAVDSFLATFSDVKKGDRFVYVFASSGLDLQFNGKQQYKGPVAALSKCILSTWIGKNPPNTALKDGLLGNSD